MCVIKFQIKRPYSGIKIGKKLHMVWAEGGAPELASHSDAKPVSLSDGPREGERYKIHTHRWENGQPRVYITELMEAELKPCRADGCSAEWILQRVLEVGHAACMVSSSPCVSAHCTALHCICHLSCSKDTHGFPMGTVPGTHCDIKKGFSNQVNIL